MTMRPVKRGKPEPEIRVILRLSVAADLVTVLQKFSNLQMEKLLHGDVEKELNENR